MDDIIAIYGNVMYSEYSDDWNSAEKLNYYDQGGYAIVVVDKNYDHYIFAEDGTFIEKVYMKLPENIFPNTRFSLPFIYAVGYSQATLNPNLYLGKKVNVYFDSVEMNDDCCGAKNVINAIRKGLQ